MRPEPREQRQLLAAHEHVDRVDLDEAHPVDDPTEMTAVDAARRPRVVETLGGERDATGLRLRDDSGSRHRGRRGRQSSATVMAIELITTSVFGLSPPPVGTLCIVSRTSRPFTIWPNRLYCGGRPTPEGPDTRKN